MIKAIIVEDEKPILDLMQFVIRDNPNYTIVGAFTNPLEALDRMSQLQPDVAFLDVEMPKMNGLELAQKINEITEQTKIVFTTAYKDYAVDAFSVQAFDYILKPVTPLAIERVTNRLKKQSLPAIREKETGKNASLQCFGRMEVRNPNGELVHWTTRKTEELFAFFLCHPKRDMSKWHLADLLWPDMAVDRASHNLHTTMYRLKKILKEYEIGMEILKTNEGYMLEPLKHAYDVWEFLQKGDLFRKDESLDVLSAEYLCSLYKGPLFEGKDYLWKVPLEENFCKQYTSMVRSLVQYDLTQENAMKAEQRLDQYLSIYPLSEEMNLLLLQVYIRYGTAEKVMKHYAKFESDYRREWAVDPPLEIKRIVSPFIQNHNA